MASSSYMPQYSQGYPVNQQSHINSGFVVINQQPSRREIFPYRLQTNWILTFGIAKCILGSLLLIAGVASVILSHQFYKYQTGFAIWCGLTVSTILAALAVLVFFKTVGKTNKEMQQSTVDNSRLLLLFVFIIVMLTSIKYCIYC